jgi:vacuolar-type H+-ATPase subunit F/Vma7
VTVNAQENVPGSVVVIGERAEVEGYALAGAAVRVAEEPAGVRAAVRDLPADATLVILTRAAAAALGVLPPQTTARQIVVLP